MTRKRAEALRRMFQEAGGRKVRLMDLAEQAITDGVYSVEELRAHAIRDIVADFRRALNEADPETGVPVAQPDEDDNWTQLDMFSPDEYAALLRRRVKDVQADAEKIHRLIDYFVVRFGYAPPVQLGLAITDEGGAR